MGCMNPLPEGRAECGICGYPANGENPSLYLPVGTVLSERYLVGRVLEVGGDGAVYIGYDKVLKSAILIREFLPDTLCGRAENGTSVAVIGGCENTFRDYRERFRTHARALEMCIRDRHRDTPHPRGPPARRRFPLPESVCTLPAIAAAGACAFPET